MCKLLFYKWINHKTHESVKYILIKKIIIHTTGILYINVYFNLIFVHVNKKLYIL